MKKEILDKIRAHIAFNKWPIPTDSPLIVYLEDADFSGNPRPAMPNHFDDWRLLIWPDHDAISQWECTTCYGKEGQKVMASKGIGVARIALGYHENVWRIGYHKSNKGHPALVQVKPIKISRDLNMDWEREGDKQYTGLFGINQHTTGVKAPNLIGPWSYGCLVGRYRKSHLEFLNILMKTERYKKNANCLWSSYVIRAKDL